MAFLVYGSPSYNLSLRHCALDFENVCEKGKNIENDISPYHCGRNSDVEHRKLADNYYVDFF